MSAAKKDRLFLVPAHRETVGHGKWSVPGIPHKGWQCVDFEDLEEPSETCQMCEIAEIRYVHVMQHPDYPDILRCGCICAGNMESDLSAAEDRERIAKNTAARKANWLRRKWRWSQKGNWFLNTEGVNIVVFRKGGSWHSRILKRETGREWFSRDLYATEDAAKLGALKGLTYIQEHFF